MQVLDAALRVGEPARIPERDEEGGARGERARAPKAAEGPAQGREGEAEHETEREPDEPRIAERAREAAALLPREHGAQRVLRADGAVRDPAGGEELRGEVVDDDGRGAAPLEHRERRLERGDAVSERLRLVEADPGAAQEIGAAILVAAFEEVPAHLGFARRVDIAGGEQRLADVAMQPSPRVVVEPALETFAEAVVAEAIHAAITDQHALAREDVERFEDVLVGGERGAAAERDQQIERQIAAVQRERLAEAPRGRREPSEARVDRGREARR